MFEIIEKGQKPFPLERAVLISIAAHILLLVLVLSAPPSTARAHPERGLLAGLVPKETGEEKIPIVFKEAPGPARENPRRSDFSDADRRAGGGDRSRPKGQTPFFEPRSGIQGLEPGRRGRVPAPSTAELRGLPVAERGRSGSADEQTRAPAIFGPPGERGQSPVSGGAEPRSEASGRLSSLDQAIRQAARDAAGGGGQAGGGFPNPDGGFVDSGPLSFDSSWYDWGPYAEEMVRRIKLHWEIPELARLGWKGKLTIRFFILADGRVADAKIIRASGIPPFDFAALQAILKSSPFRPLPADLGSSREGVTVTFFYNLRPEKETRPEGTR
ncbi:MAG TPA: energy transducer TonB [Thermoanaerobaculia bacterium]